MRYRRGSQIGYFPNGPAQATPDTASASDTLPKALLTAAVFLILFLLFNYVLVATARAHATVARVLLHGPADPLREAKEVLGPAGPLDESEPKRRFLRQTAGSHKLSPPTRVQLARRGPGRGQLARQTPTAPTKGTPHCVNRALQYSPSHHPP